MILALSAETTHLASDFKVSCAICTLTVKGVAVKVTITYKEKGKVTKHEYRYTCLRCAEIQRAALRAHNKKLRNESQGDSSRTLQPEDVPW